MELKDAVFAVIFIIIAILSILFNVFVFLTCVRRKRLRTPSRYFLISLAFADICAVALWTFFAVITAVSGEWVFPDVICKVQEYVMSLCFLMNMHTFVLLSFERFLQFFRPSRHDFIFIDTAVILMIVALWFFNAVVSSFPFFDWGNIAFFKNQYQCALDYEKNTRHMNFSVVIGLGIPVFLLLVVYITILVRLKFLKKKNVQSEGEIVVQVNRKATGDSYAQRLKNQQYKFQDAGMKREKPRIGKKLTYTADGYISNDSSDDEQTKKTMEARKNKKDKKPVGKKVYELSKNDVTITKTYVIMSVIYTLCWLPYIIVSYILTYDRYAPINDTVIAIAVCVTHATSFVKPLIYAIQNDYFRRHFKKSVSRNKYKSFDKRSKNSESSTENAENVDN